MEAFRKEIYKGHEIALYFDKDIDMSFFEGDENETGGAAVYAFLHDYEFGVPFKKHGCRTYAELVEKLAGITVEDMQYRFGLTKGIPFDDAEISSRRIVEWMAKRKKWIFNLYAYIHGGIAVSMNQFSDPWDSGLAGCVVLNKADFPDKEKAIACAKSYVKSLDNHLTGQVFGYMIRQLGPGEEGYSQLIPETKLDSSLWGIDSKEYAIQEAKAEIDSAIEHAVQPLLFQAV